MVTLYFAYGSNMDRRQMAGRCRHASSVGVAALSGWRFLINSAGWATIISESGATVHGCLWELTPGDEAALDLYEGLAEGLYLKERLPAQMLSGARREAMVYVATDSAPGTPHAGYLESILAAAVENRFPEDYLRELMRWKGRTPGSATGMGFASS